MCEVFKYGRKIRGDGNCFYRALVFALIEENNNFIDPEDEEWKEYTEEQKKENIASRQKFDAFFDKLARGSLLQEDDRVKLAKLKKVCSFTFLHAFYLFTKLILYCYYYSNS